MRRAALVALLASSGCHDFPAAYQTCLEQGACLPPGGAPSALTVEPSAADFGVIPIKAKGPPQTLTVTNGGAASSGALTVAIGGASGSAWLLAADACGGKDLAPGATCTFQLTFAPQKQAEADAVATISSAHGSATVNLHGTGAAESTLTLSPTTVAFGNLLVHAAATPRRLTLTNGGASTTTAVAALLYGPDASEFALQGDGCTGQLLAPAAKCTLDVAFTPSGPGARVASLQLQATTGGLVTAALSGTGLAPGDLGVAPSTFDFGSASRAVPSPPRTFRVTNSGATATGNLTVTVSGQDASDFLVQAPDGCSGRPLAAGAGCDVALVLAPTAGGAKSASLSIAGTPGGATTAALTGTGLAPAALTFAPNPVDFASVGVGSGAPLILTLTNSGGVATAALSLALSTGADTNGFTITSPPADACSGKLLAGGASCSFELRFAPPSLGQATATVIVSAAGLSSLQVPVRGLGVARGALFLSGSLDFGDVPLGSTGQRTVNLTNTGGANSGVISLTGTGPNGSELSFSSDTCSTKVLGAGASCTVTVGFTPRLAGPRNASVTASATPGGPETKAITGRGSAEVSVTLTGSGSGAVTSAPAGLDCLSGSCTASFPVASVTLTATATAPSSFSGFTGCDAVPTATTCLLGLDGGRSVGANFLGACNGGPCTVQLTLAGRDGGSGVLRFPDGGLACGAPSCTFRVDAGTALRFIATPAGSDGFESWTGTGPCAMPPDCAFTVDGDISQAAVFSRFNRAFVTSKLVLPQSLGGVAGADALCNALARDAGQPGNYRALLADSSTSDIDHIGGARGWVRPDGLPFMDQLTTSGSVFYPPRLTERGVDVLDGGRYQPTTDRLVVTSNLLGAAASFCGDWTVSGGTQPSFGVASGAGYEWYNSFFQTGSCSAPARVLCLGVDYQAQVPPPAAKGRFAFTSLNGFIPGGGIASADALCAAEAADAGLPGSYLALLGDSTAPSATWSRFDGGGPQWVRPDGVIFAKDPNRFVHLTALPTAPLAVTARGDSPYFVNLYVWGGRNNDLSTTPTVTCNGWQTSSSLGSGGEGNPFDSSPHWMYMNGSGCGPFTTSQAAPRIYCLQQ